MTTRIGRGALGASMLALALTGCSIGDIAGNVAGNALGGRGSDFARAGAGMIDVIPQMQVKFSLEQEGALGRAAAAEIVARYGLDPNETLQAYVREVGASIVSLSNRLRGTFAGYYFAVLDDDTPNGWSAPGGWVFVTRGAVQRAVNEDELAAILCHELSHIHMSHAEKVILRGRQSGVLGAALGRLVGAASEGQGALTGQAKMFGDLGESVFAEMGRNGYGRDAEFEADREAAYLLYDVGYDASSMKGYLSAVGSRLEGTWATHPPAAVRIQRLSGVTARYGGHFEPSDPQDKAQRAARFQRVMSGGQILLPGEAMPRGEYTGQAAPDQQPWAGPATQPGPGTGAAPYQPAVPPPPPPPTGYIVPGTVAR